MTWPAPLPAPRPIRAQGPLAAHFAEAAVASAAASRWARLLELPVEATPQPGAPSRSSLRAWAAFSVPDGRVGALAVDRHLLAGVVGRLAGTSGRPVGPCALSPAEEGLFAYLALDWLDAAPQRPSLAWVHGGDPAWPLALSRHAGIPWRLEIAGQIGQAVWWLPHRRPQGPAAEVPVPLWVGCTTRLGAGTLRPGDRLPCPPPALSIVGEARPRFGVALDAGGLRLTRLEVSMSSTALDALPVALTLELGGVVLPAGEVAGLAEGDLLPVQVASPPVVTVKAGDQPIAMGVLVADAGGISVQLTRVVGQPSAT